MTTATTEPPATCDQDDPGDVSDSLFEYAPDATLLVAHDGRILRANPQAELVFGYGSGKMVGLPVEALIPARYAGQHVALREGYTQAPRARRMGSALELQGRRADGSEFAVEVALGPVRNSRPEQILCIVRDITERKLAEQELRRAHDLLEQRVQERTTDLSRANLLLAQYTVQLERSNRELQDFAFAASHDLQEPLRKIQAFGERLKSRSPHLDEQSQDYLARMQSAAARMQTLIQDLLAFSRVMTRGQPFKPVPLKEVLREVLSDLEVRIEQVGATIEADELPVVQADRTQMRQLLQNLIGNALKFRHPTRRPVVRVSANKLPPEPGGTERTERTERIELVVADNGIGFEGRYADRIFGLFQRLHGRTEYEGSGVGLAICRRIAERHGGTINATAVPDRGATFTVVLPLKQPKGAGH
jgi:two-component system sensor kinase FixL